MNFSRFTAIGITCFTIGLFTNGLACAQEASASLEQSVGYYPTFEESGIIATNDYDYTRGSGGLLNGPDLDRWAATGGIWPYEYQTGGLTWLQRKLQPVDYILRPFTPGETLVVQGPVSESWLQMGGSFPFLSRTYHRDRSQLADLFGMEAAQNFPLFFDVTSISLWAAYVDGRGAGYDAGTVDDGFVGALSFDFRLGWMLTDRTTLLIAGQLFFVYSDDTDAQFYLDAGGLSAFASFNYQKEIGDWDFRVFDDLTPFSTRRLFFEETYQGDVQRTGPYWIAPPGGALESGDWWDSRNHYLLNTAGITAGTFIGESLRFLLGFGRIDSWQWNDFEHQRANEYASAGLFYDGYDLWLAPAITYGVYTHDFEDPQQQVMLSAVAPISPNITANGGVGYSWGEFYEGFNWSVGLAYQQTDRLHHTFSYSSGYQEALVGDDFTGNWFQYGVGYQLGPRITLGGYAGWFTGSGQSGDALNVGATANIALGNYSHLSVLGGFYDWDLPDAGTDGSQWVYRVTLARRLAERLNGELSYEYIDSGIGNYQESIFSLRITKSF